MIDKRRFPDGRKSGQALGRLVRAGRHARAAVRSFRSPGLRSSYRAMPLQLDRDATYRVRPDAHARGHFRGLPRGRRLPALRRDTDLGSSAADVDTASTTGKALPPRSTREPAYTSARTTTPSVVSNKDADTPADRCSSCALDRTRLWYQPRT